MRRLFHFFALIGLMSFLTTVHAAPKSSASDLQFKHLTSGHVSRLEDFGGKLLIVHVWATWCGACVQEMPSLRKFNANLPEGTHLLMVSSDFGSSEKLKSFMTQNHMQDMDIVHDPSINDQLNVSALPTTLFMNAQGQEVGRLVGRVAWQSDKIQQYLDKLIKANNAK